MYNTPLKDFGFSSLGEITFSDMLLEFNAFARDLATTVDDIRDSNFDKKECVKLLSDFYMEGWDINFSGENGFYTLEKHFKEITEVLAFLSQKEDDLKIKKELKSSLIEIWKRLPDFYQAHDIAGLSSIKPPLNYKTEDPYPRIMSQLS